MSSDSKPKSSEKDLIEAAFGQVDATPDADAFAGETLPAPGTFPGYDLLRTVHTGGQGTVYLAVQRATKRRVALKVMHGGAALGSAGRARFEREVQVLGQLNHPNIVKIHDSGVTPGGDCYYVMDYISGKALEEFIRGGKLSVDDAIALFLKICEGVNAAHLRGVIHRDLKPGNIRIDLAGEPIIVDFGLAKVAGPDVAGEGSEPMTMTGQFVGSLPWASPEQAQGSPEGIDIRSDVYSLGVIFYQLLTGRFPYSVIGNMRDVLDNILRAEPARPSTVRKQINNEVETIVLKCLHKERARRYQSAGELARDLVHYVRGEPIEAKRDSGWYVIRKTLARHRAVAGVVLLAAALLAGWGVTAVVLIGRERDAARLAERRRAAAENAEARAAQNFETVRSLARAVLSDLDREVSSLRGSARVRERLLDETRRYIASLSAQSADNPALQREIADAEQLAAEIMGGLEYRQSVGRTDDARAALARSRAIRDDLLARFPDEARSHADVGRSLRAEAGLQHIEAKFTQAASTYQDAIACYDRAVQLETDDGQKAAWADGRSHALRGIGDACIAALQAESSPERRVALLDRADETYREFAAYWDARLADGSGRSPGMEDVARNLGIAHDKQAAALLSRVDEVIRGARAMGSTRPDLAARQWELAASLALRAQAVAREAQTDFVSLVEQYPGDRLFRRDVYLAHHNLGLALAKSGAIESEGFGRDGAAMREAALGAYEQALEVTRGLASDEADVQAQRDLVVCLAKVGQTLLALQRFEEALPRFEESLAIRDLLAREDPTPRSRRDAARARNHLGGFYEEYAKATTDAGARRGRYEQALQWYLRYQDEVEALIDERLLPADGADAEEARTVLARVRGALAEEGSGN